MKKIVLVLSLFIASLGVLQSAVAADGVVASGTLSADFSSWGKASLAGDWKIIEKDGKRFIELADNFKAKEGPDVEIFLSPKPSTAITGDNATEGSVFIKIIKNFEGKDQIEIPANIDISQYKSLVFHCKEYSKLWGVSPL